MTSLSSFNLIGLRTEYLLSLSLPAYYRGEAWAYLFTTVLAILRKQPNTIVILRTQLTTITLTHHHLYYCCDMIYTSDNLNAHFTELRLCQFVCRR